MRVVLKAGETGLYLQPNGAWSQNRESAREFVSSVEAYWWAIERGLQGTEVWLAVTDPKKDFPCITIQSDSNRPAINCNYSDWREALHSHLFNGIEVDLLDFDYARHGESCELLAQAFVLDFSLGRDPKGGTAHFRKKVEWCDSKGQKKSGK
jgi:hypothetical protein